MAQGDGTFDVVPSEVSDAGRYVQMTAEELVDAVRTLDTEITRLLEGWTGISATAYRAGWEETRQGAQTVLDSLKTLAELLGVTADAHTQLDTTWTTNISSLDLP
ncbi:WXG100 family type VII secretion target [Nocardia huaxiensis]|uniref:ESAT-6-like protein n=1 Tax=Nocardia huaxiensis TaxID=2755382 RepID=A0A7D6VHZ8_9NOCA|nr:WXG100 family type VII secretion target [Nocardia huaxiensis]QLY30030.1 WXG100 family type VII secretion target [Nocardia huaxiensis]UFS96374.1 WXG100 family type VII secretion target [Nocardia huaxiensis]